MHVKENFCHHAAELHVLQLTMLVAGAVASRVSVLSAAYSYL